MRPTRRSLAVAAAVAAAAGAVFAPAAYADTSSTTPTTGSAAASTLAAIKAKAASAISLRDSALQAAITAYTANQYLAPADRSAVLTTLNSDLSGLNALAPVIQADTTIAKARADYSTIFTAYRVFALALPQSRFAASADDLTGTVVPRLTDAQSRLQALLSGPDSGKNTPPVQAAMTDLAGRISGITTATSGLAATVLAYTPSQWDANPTILAQPRLNLVTARTDARLARQDIDTVVKALQ